MRGRALALAWAISLGSACHHGPTSAGISDATRPDGGPTDGAATVSLDPTSLDLWARAEGGDLDDLARLCRHEGSDRLIEVAADAPRRVTALRALAFSGDLTPLPFLADVAWTGTDDEAAESLLAAASLLAEPRRATDPEDALEIQQGTTRLLALAKDVQKSRVRRTLAVRVLRLLADRGAVASKDIPVDLDAR